MKSLKFSFAGTAFQGWANRIFLVSFFALVVVSCGKDKDVVKIPSTGNKLVSVVIPRAENPGYSEDGFAYEGTNNVYITLPEGADLSKVHMDFLLSPDATITLNGKEVSKLSGTFDLTNTAEVIVTSESGAANMYHILAQTGIASLDKLIYEFKEKYSIPGVSYAILKMSNSQIVYKEGLGFAEKEGLVRTKPDNLFRLGSISKQFTSICIMTLIQQGKLTVESKVFGPDGILKDAYPDVTAMAAKVTVKDLLDHTSGWTSDPDPMFSSSFSGQTLDQRIKYVLTSPQVEPGTAYSYFNMGFGILGEVIEKITGKKYGDYLEEVLAKADITDIHVGGDRSHKRPNEVVYYSQDGYNGYLNDMQVIQAAGGVIASTEQMLKLITYIDGKPNPPDILTPEIRTLMLTASSNSDKNALGWMMNHRLFPNSWYHGGNLAGTATFWVMGPEYSTVILCNSRSYLDGFDDDFYYISQKMINLSATLF